jgi:hypothetical protein
VLESLEFCEHLRGTMSNERGCRRKCAQGYETKADGKWRFCREAGILGQMFETISTVHAGKYNIY